MIFRLIHRIINSLYFLSIKILLKINSNKYSKAFILNKLLSLNSKILKILNYKIPITFKNDGKTIFDLNGIKIIDSNLHRRHLKNYDLTHHNEAYKFFKYFETNGGKTIMDLGANEGELSIFFAKKINCKVFAIECAQKNLDFLYKNIELNNIKNIKTFKYTISDKDNLSLEVDFKSNATQVKKRENSANLKSQNDVVESITSSTFIKKQNISFIDLIKIDIENSNFLVGDCILKNSKIIKSVFWELSFNEPEKYKKIILKLNEIYDLYIFNQDNFIKISIKGLLVKIDDEVRINNGGFDIFLFSTKYYKNNEIYI